EERASKEMLEELLSVAVTEQDDARASLERQAKVARDPASSELAIALAEHDEARRGRDEARAQLEVTITEQGRAQANKKAAIASQLAGVVWRDAAMAERQALAAELAKVQDLLEKEQQKITETEQSLQLVPPPPAGGGASIWSWLPRPKLEETCECNAPDPV